MSKKPTIDPIKPLDIDQSDIQHWTFIGRTKDGEMVLTRGGPLTVEEARIMAEYFDQAAHEYAAYHDRRVMELFSQNELDETVEDGESVAFQ